MLAEDWSRIVVALGVTIRDLRTLLGWSQQELADRAVTSQGTVSRLESGRYGDTPFHSVVVVLRTLGAGAMAMDLTVSPTTRALLQFMQSLSPAIEVVDPPDPNLIRIVRTFHQMPPRQRVAFMRVVRAVGDLAGRDEQREVAV
jgi:transcriptional regulator with XRE-family HTH domain